MLQNIVASIDTKEASKLLERANRLLNRDDGHKLSLKQLLVGDSDSEDEDSKPSTSAKKTEEKKKKGRPVKAKEAPKVQPKKSPKAPTPGTRRSRRLQVPDDQPDDQPKPALVGSSDDENQLVIDEGQDLDQEKKANKGQRGKRKVSEAADEESVIKEEPNAEDDILKPKTRMSRMTSRMAPKSKTWFPNAQDRVGTKNALGANSINKLKSPNRIEVKREPKDPDMKVFAVSEEVVIPESFLAQDKIENSKFPSNGKSDIKSRLSSLNNLFSKINNKDDNEEVTKEPIEEVMTKVQNKDDNDELSVTLKQPLPEIIVKETIGNGQFLFTS